MFSRSTTLCLLNCITQTIQVTEAQTFSSRALCGPRASCWAATIDRNSWYRFLLSANMYVAFFEISRKNGKWHTSVRVRRKLDSKFMTNLHERWKRLLKTSYLGRNNIELTINRQNTVKILRADTENCSSTFIPNVGNYVPNHTASHSRRQILTNFVEQTTEYSA